MLSWLTSNAGNIIVSALLIAIVSLIIVKMIKDKKKGKSSCGCGCANCALNGQCHKKPE
ncbi:MAG: FeoB-associated Cys-rich membrane protein [Bacteroidales bacterium]|nr:FeoB-associated Cys-rich membrane protein [Lachnoclostridium sp.]MCM1385020.1 FeoB-associated Cys-rich membrane protein [Lachnoclostridium sp.]MCM1465909.1 FeoB-associated Cys-rich membrane protein [Bacteroidales bacterium]